MSVAVASLPPPDKVVPYMYKGYLTARSAGHLNIPVSYSVWDLKLYCVCLSLTFVNHYFLLLEIVVLRPCGQFLQGVNITGKISF